MSKKRSQIDRAIDSLEGEVAVLQAAIVKLKQQREKAPVDADLRTVRRYDVKTFDGAAFEKAAFDKDGKKIV